MKRSPYVLLLLFVLLVAVPVLAADGRQSAARQDNPGLDASPEPASRSATHGVAGAGRSEVQAPGETNAPIPARRVPWFEPTHLLGGPPSLGQRAPLVLRAPTAPTLGGDWSNGAALGCIIPLGIVNNAAFGAGLTAPPPWDAAAGVAEYAANLGLKFCAPALYPPPDQDRTHAVDENGQCSWTFNQPQWEGDYENFMGFTLPWGDVFPGRAWGDLGEPVIVHWNTDVAVSLETSWADAIGRDNYRLPVGIHRLTWRGDTQIGPLDFVYTYIPGWAWTRMNKLLKLEGVAEQATEQTLDAVIGLAVGEVDLIPTWSTMYNEEIQRVAVTDLTAPTVQGPGAVQLEAVEPGGLSRNTYLYHLRRTLTVSDNCDGNPDLFAEQESLLPDFVAVGESATVTWLAEDGGPRDLGGGRNRSGPLSQTFTVADTLVPIIVPPPDVVTETTTLPALISLGHPGTFDLADLNPTVSHNACSRPGVVCSGDSIRFPAGKTTVTWSATDSAGNSSSTSQYVNVKSLGSNQDPTANGGSADAISYEPITLTLQAGDPDGDRLWFQIEDQPAGGFFRAPLYPYFIQDYRLANVAGIDFDEYCSQEEHRGDSLPVNWPVDARFMTVDDEGNVYVQDQGIVRCRSFDDGWNADYRLAIFRPDGTWEESSSDLDVKDIQVDLRNDILYTARHGVGGANPRVNVYDLDLNRLASYRTDYTDPFIRDPKSVAIDVERNLLYVTNGYLSIGTSQLVLMRYDPDAPPSDDDPEGIAEYEGFGDGPHVWLDLALDGQGNLYASEREGDRIYKWSAPTVHDDGSVAPGELIGWMGRCDSGPGCDQANGRSFGYSCTDTTCTVSETSGDRPGQFDSPRGIALDNNDILYVTDYWNYRVQRFTPNGFFAGQAISECDGSCFVLGDFGAPQQVTVNSSHFYVLDRSDDLLHVFETTPITRLTDDSAEIVYQSDNNFVGADTFTYRVSDGLDSSAPAAVSLNVTRNNRPPTAIGPLQATTDEDVPVELPVDGYDPDGDLDILTYQTVDPPANGRFVSQGSNYVYEPDPDFAGADTFTYAASDGVFLSPAQTVTVTVTPVNDPPRFPDGADAGGPNRPSGFALHSAGSFSLGRLAPLGTADDPLRVGRGFTTVINVTFEDPDVGDVHLVTVDWGDGTPLEHEGQLLDDGAMTGPVLSEGVTGGPGSVTAEHAFSSSGEFTAEVCVSDNVSVDVDGNKSLTAASATSCLPVSFTVAPMVDLLVDIQPSANPYAAGDPLSYDLVVTNHAPSSGAGLTASGLRIADTLDTRLIAGNATVDGGACDSSGHTVTCNLDPLPPGESVTIHIPVQVPATIEPGMVLANHVAYEVDQENQATVLENGDVLTVVAPADYVVNTIADQGDDNPGDGVCATADGHCSLRAAVSEANLQPGPQTISLPDWHFLLEGELGVGDDLALTGLGAGRTIIAGPGETRLFYVIPNVTVALNALTLQGGDYPGDGGAVGNDGNLSLHGVQISGNQAGGAGGAIYNQGNLTVSNSSLTGNDSDGGAGAIANMGTLVLQNVTISGNQGVTGGLDNGGDATLENVTLTGNHAIGAGGGLRNATTATLILRNTIVAASTAEQTGPDCDGAITSHGHNLLGDPAGCTVNNAQNDIVGQAARLAPLERGASNTMAHSLLGGSPAIDAGSCQLPADQHAIARPVDGNLDGIVHCDIGATEFVPLRLLLPLLARD